MDSLKTRIRKEATLIKKRACSNLSKASASEDRKQERRCDTCGVPGSSRVERWNRRVGKCVRSFLPCDRNESNGHVAKAECAETPELVKHAQSGASSPPKEVDAKRSAKRQTSKIVVYRDGTSRCVAILPSVDLYKDLQEAVKDNRGLEEKERDQRSRIEQLCDEQQTIENEICEIKAEINDSEAVQSSFETLCERLADRQAQLGRITQEQQGCECSIARLYASQVQGQQILFTRLDRLFTSNGILDPKPEANTDGPTSYENQAASDDGWAECDNAFEPEDEDRLVRELLFSKFQQASTRLSNAEQALENRQEYDRAYVE